MSREFSEEFGRSLVTEASQAGAIVVGDEGLKIGVTLGMVEEQGEAAAQRGARAGQCTAGEAQRG